MLCNWVFLVTSRITGRCQEGRNFQNWKPAHCSKYVCTCCLAQFIPILFNFKMFHLVRNVTLINSKWKINKKKWHTLSRKKKKSSLLRGLQSWLYKSTSCWFVLLLLGLNISMAEGEEGNWQKLWLPAMLNGYFTKLLVGLTCFSFAWALNDPLGWILSPLLIDCLSSI